MKTYHTLCLFVVASISAIWPTVSNVVAMKKDMSNTEQITHRILRLQASMIRTYNLSTFP